MLNTSVAIGDLQVAEQDSCAYWKAAKAATIQSLNATKQTSKWSV